MSADAARVLDSGSAFAVADPGKRDETSLARDVLVRIGHLGPGGRERLPHRAIVVGALAVSAAALAASLVLPPDGLGERVLQALSAASAAVGFALAYLQWRAARHEVSFDRYYERLNLANQRFDAARLKELEGDPPALKEHLYTMFVFAELDNLEYVLGKHRLGYVRVGLACQALRAFEARCDDDGFRDAARR